MTARYAKMSESRLREGALALQKAFTTNGTKQGGQVENFQKLGAPMKKKNIFPKEAFMDEKTLQLSKIILEEENDSEEMRREIGFIKVELQKQGQPGIEGLKVY